MSFVVGSLPWVACAWHHAACFAQQTPSKPETSTAKFVLPDLNECAGAESASVLRGCATSGSALRKGLCWVAAFSKKQDCWQTLVLNGRLVVRTSIVGPCARFHVIIHRCWAVRVPAYPQVHFSIRVFTALAGLTVLFDPRRRLIRA